jgi:peptidyl-prolyl cis-trans isomerase D
MLEQIRKGQRWLTGILIALVGGVFVFFMGLGGPLEGGGPAQGLVVELGDIRLGVADFQRIRAQQAELYREQLGDQFNTQVAASYLDAQALRSLVERAILAHDAMEMGLRVGKSEIQRLIRDSPGFRDESGKFNSENFESFVEYEYGSQRNYLDYMQRVLLGQKLAQLLYTQGEVSEGEARRAVLQRLQQVQIAFVALDTETLPYDAVVSDEEIAAYAATNPAELQAAYDANLEEFQTVGRIHLRHILFEIPSGATDEERAAAQADARAALDRLAAGEAFDALARELSDDGSTRDSGGDLGAVTLEEIARELAAAAASLEVGRHSEIVASDRGLHIVLLAERLAGGSRTFDEVKLELAERGLRKQKARSRADDLTDQLATAIRAGQSLEDAARALELPIERTDLLRRRADGFVPGLGGSPELLATAFSLSLDAPSSPEIFAVSTKLALIQLLDRREPDEAVLAEALLGERERLEAAKRNAFLQSWIELRRAELQKSGELLIDNSVVEPS